MSIKETIQVKGRLHIERRNAAGELVEVRDINNLVVTLGKNFIASRMNGTTPAVMPHMAVGTSGTAAALGDSALGGEVGRVALTPSVTNNVVSYSGVFGPGVGTGALQEAGIFNASSAGTLLARSTFPVLNKAAGDTVTIAWSVTIG